MADINIDGVVTWLKNWFYDKTEITGFLNNKANQSDLQTTNGNLANLSSTVDNKVDKITGKGLSTEDFTTALKDKLDGIEAQANKTTVDSALSSTSTNPLQNKAINTALGGKAPTSHASSATTYGVGTTSNYGHVKTINGLTQSSHTNGTALSAYQGKVLKDLVDEKADSTHPHGTADITESSALSNIGTSANTTQSNINTAIDTAIGNLSSIQAIQIVTTLPTASSSTMGKLYIINENSKINVYYTKQDGTNYSWHKMDTDILDELRIDWADVNNKPLTFTPSSHTQPTDTITNDILYDNFPQQSSQAGINNSIDNWIGNFNTSLTSKGALTDDIDWTYSSNGFTNGVKLVSKTDNANGRITLHLKS